MGRRRQLDSKKNIILLYGANLSFYDMNTPLFIAKRYLFSKKSVHAINIISGISAFGVLVGTAALIIILSAFNGLERMILTMYSTFTPELRIEPATGKFFHIDSVDQKWLKDNPKVLYYA